MHPKKITPNPLASSTIEIRFKTAKESSSILKSFFDVLSDELPKLESTSIPREIRIKHQDLKYVPDYILSNDDYSVSFNENFVGFENITEYQLWGEYSSVFKKILDSILSTNIIENIERIGVRYQSKFETNDFSNIVKEIPKLKIDEFEENFLAYSTKLNSDEFDILLRLKKDITESEFDSEEEKKEQLIDIDVYILGNIEYSDIFNKINSAHILLKKLFFGLLKDDFIKTLNPEY